MGESNCSRMDVDNDTCHFKHHINPPVNRLISASMFALGIFGNVAALVVLEIRRRRNVRSGGTWQRSLFHIFITSLVVTDLTGTCFTTPLVQLSYSRNLTLLYRMYQRRRRNGSVMSTMRSNSERKLLSMSEEVEHLIMMVVMTVIFIICTLPLVIRVYINYNGENDHASDLNALRFISVNSIVDPWVFILLSPGVQHFCWTSVCRSTLIAQRGSVFKSSLAKENAKLELSRPTLYTEQIDSVKNM
ncbi:prostaglandin E receptor 2a (subtype EP2) isoform X2 [Pelmatolapia mariae]|uniref:prostaglandin E receptor 2a (subtype EP2) isoform X2 n=1 Tax=Pelmatolapia mariae TaxID=158779 RepID=UPI002FE6A385